MPEARQVSLPSPNIEVKIVLPIPFRSSGLKANSLKGLPGRRYAARQKTGPNRFERVHGGSDCATMVVF